MGNQLMAVANARIRRYPIFGGIAGLFLVYLGISGPFGDAMKAVYVSLMHYGG